MNKANKPFLSQYFWDIDLDNFSPKDYYVCVMLITKKLKKNMVLSE